MKTINIGDIHGKTIWKTIDPELYNKIIFLGDYVDSFDESNMTIENNLLDIIQFKKDFNDKVVLLLGNHDLQYLFQYYLHGCSGYRSEMYTALHKIFTENKDLFCIAYEYDNTIWTHAGIHAGWYEYRFKYKDETILSDRLNHAFDDYYKPLFDVGYIRGGDHDVGGPFWCDINELSSKPLHGYNQIVGHNRVKYIKKIYKYNQEIVFIDTLESDNPKFFEKEFK